MPLSAEQIQSTQYASGKFIRARNGVRLPGLRMNIQNGFTLVELVTVMIIAAILAATILPRFVGKSEFESRGFYDQVISTLRYAQKEAIAQHRFVCVTFATNSITLTYDTVTPSPAHLAANCTQPLPLVSLAGNTPNNTITATGNVTMSGGQPFNFDALGRASALQAITVLDYPKLINVIAETGYVY